LWLRWGRQRPRQTATAKWKTANGILETATPHRVCFANRPLPQGARERLKGKRHLRDSAHSRRMTSHGISVSGLPRGYIPIYGASPSQLMTATATTKWKTTTALLETATPHRVSLCETPSPARGEGKTLRMRLRIKSAMTKCLSRNPCSGGARPLRMRLRVKPAMTRGDARNDEVLAGG
jgi:hypothetical protein